VVGGQVPDVKLKYRFEDFQTSDEVEAALIEAAPRWRSMFIKYEYVLLRSELLGTPRPPRRDLRVLGERVARSRPVQAVIFLTIHAAAVIGIAAATVLVWQREGTGIGLSSMALPTFGLYSLYRWYRVLLGPEGQAMRLISRARGVASSERLAMLQEAVRLDSRGNSGFRLFW